MGRVVLFGATGYTGALTARALVAAGARPLLAGRTASRLETLAAELGGGLETQTADVGNPASVAALVEPGDVLLSTVGPFTRWGKPALEAAIAAGIPYIDSTGETPFIRSVFTEYGPRAAASGATLMTAFGYDWVPGNLAGALALEAAGETATKVDIGYFMKGRGKPSTAMSGGTRASVMEVLLASSYAYRDGRLVTERGARSHRTFDLGGGRRGAAVSAGTTEPFSLPSLYPQLRDVGVYLGWFGPLSRGVQLGSVGLAGVGKLPALSRAVTGSIRKAVKGSTGGPDAEERARTSSLICAEAFDASGAKLSTVRVAGVNGYEFTAAFLSWAARAALADGVQGIGPLGPVEAFGLEALEAGVAEAGLVAQS